MRNLGLGGRTCLDSPARKRDLKKAVGLYPCHNQGGNQVKFLSTFLYNVEGHNPNCGTCNQNPKSKIQNERPTLCLISFQFLSFFSLPLLLSFLVVIYLVICCLFHLWFVFNVSWLDFNFLDSKSTVRYVCWFSCKARGHASANRFMALP